MKKPVFWQELAFLLGLAALALGAALMAKGDFGMSMVVAPAYVLHLKVSQTWAFFTFGVAEYLVQALLLGLLCLVMGRFRLVYLLSFATTFLYGRMLDGFVLLLAPLPAGDFLSRLLFYLPGALLCALGVALIFVTYLPPEVYELFIKEVARRHHIPLSRFKTGYDLSSCLLAVCLSFLFFGLFHFEGVKLGTFLCALVTGRLVGLFDRILTKFWQFEPARPRWEAFFRSADGKQPTPPDHPLP